MTIRGISIHAWTEAAIPYNARAPTKSAANRCSATADATMTITANVKPRGQGSRPAAIGSRLCSNNGNTRMTAA
jgi:hypothetical protein